MDFSTFIPMYASLLRHKKTLRLKRILKTTTPTIIGYLYMLWTWAAGNAEDGDLSQITAEDIAEICEWKKSPKILLDALIEVGFIEQDMKLHDWEDYIGALVDKRNVKREQSRIRQQRYRERLKTQNSESEITQDNADITRYERVNNSPNRIEQNRIEQNRIEQNSKSSIHNSPSISQVSATEDRPTDGDDETLESIYEQCEMERFQPNISIMLKNAIECMYYSKTLKIGNAQLPQEKVRSCLHLLDSDMLDEVLTKMKQNTAKVKNPNAYLMSMIYNSVVERNSGYLLDMPEDYIGEDDIYSA